MRVACPTALPAGAPHAARFIGKNGCDAYFRNNKNLLFYERKAEIVREIEEMGLE